MGRSKLSDGPTVESPWVIKYKCKMMFGVTTVLLASAHSMPVKMFQVTAFRWLQERLQFFKNTLFFRNELDNSFKAFEIVARCIYDHWFPNPTWLNVTLWHMCCHYPDISENNLSGKVVYKLKCPPSHRPAVLVHGILDKVGLDFMWPSSCRSCCRAHRHNRETKLYLQTSSTSVEFHSLCSCFIRIHLVAFLRRLFHHVCFSSIANFLHFIYHYYASKFKTEHAIKLHTQLCQGQDPLWNLVIVKIELQKQPHWSLFKHCVLVIWGVLSCRI